MKIPPIVRKISKKERKTLERRGLKLTEEAGELAAEILKHIGEKGRKGKTKAEVLDHLHLEAVDVMLMAMDILAFTGATDKKITTIMNAQLGRWTKGFDENQN